MIILRRLRKRIYLSFMFGTSVYPMMIAASICCAFIYSIRPAALLLTSFIWIKVVTSALLLLLFHWNYANRLFFFHNLGLKKSHLYLFTFVVDQALWILMIVILSNSI